MKLSIPIFKSGSGRFGRHAGPTIPVEKSPTVQVLDRSRETRSTSETAMELIERHVVHAFRNRRGDAVEHHLLQSVPFCRLFQNNQIAHSSSTLLGIIGNCFSGHYLASQSGAIESL